MERIKRFLRSSWLYQSRFDRNRERELSIWSSHDQQKLEFYGQFVSAGNLCFDVGANFGNRTKILRKLGAKIIAIEPQSRCAQVLKSAFDGDTSITILQTALGEQPGEAKLRVSDATTISSMSQEWIQSVRASGRFSDALWNREIVVPVTTLDRLIEQYGKPAFIKIDVEGYEYEVLQGLSQPVRMVSIEFTPERIDASAQCLNRLQSLAPIEANFSIGESMRFSLDQWVSVERCISEVSSRSTNKTFGDIYIRSAVS